MTDTRSQPTPEPVRQHAPLPWSYRPWDFDDWGFIRADDGSLAAIARGSDHKTHDEHREAGTDPYGPNAAFIIDCVNSHASLKARVQELEATLKWIEARDRMWTAPEYEKGNEVLERGPHNIKIRGSYGAAANLVLKRAALSQSSDLARTEQERGK